MNLEYDKVKINEGIELGAYDEKGLTLSKSRKWHYPSKLLFIRLLEPFVKKEWKDIRGKVDIWSERNWTLGTETIHVLVTYKVKDLGEAQR